MYLCLVFCLHHVQCVLQVPPPAPSSVLPSSLSPSILLFALSVNVEPMDAATLFPSFLIADLFTVHDGLDVET